MTKEKQETKEMFRKYAELFNTPLGKEVLKDMQNIWRSEPYAIDLPTLAHLEGQRHFLRFIEAQIKRGNKE